MITKKQFKSILQGLKAQEEFDRKASDAFSDIFIDFQGWYNNEILFQSIRTFLENHFKDEGNWIGYYMYELDWGVKWTKHCCKEADGTMIDISIVEKLYDFLIKNMEE